MKGSRAAVLAAVAVVLIAGGWWLFSRGPGSDPIDLISVLDTAVKRPEGAFEVVEVELDGETKRAIAPPTPSRLTYRVQVPDNAWVRVAVGMKPEAWTAEGDGVLFLFGVSDGRTYDELFTQHVHPFQNTGDRKWIQVWVDISAYAGEEVELIFNTRNSLPEKENDPRNDLALWGEPTVVVR